MNKSSPSEVTQHKLFVKWMELQRARSYVGREIPEERDVLSWESSNPSIKECWEKLTRPANLDALRTWLAESSDTQRRLWTEQAIMQAEQRVRGESHDASP